MSNDDPDPLISGLLSSRRREALEWLRQSNGRATLGQPTLGGADPTAASIALVEEIYAAGATRVIAAEIDEYPEADGVIFENTGKLLIELPADAGLRRRVFHWQANMARTMGFDGEADHGQAYLFVMLD